MSATERLRELLDERGVEHEGGERSMRWRDRYGIMMQAFPLANGELGMDVWSCTPEQAIVATLGAGTCELTRASWDDGTCTWGCICSACDAHLEHETGIGYNFCPICGAKVVDE